MAYETLTQQIEALNTRKISCRELMSEALDRIAQHDAQINSFIFVADREHLLAQAALADAAREAGNAAPFAGIPFAHKDIFVTRDAPTTCGSKMLDGYVSPFDATVVEKCRAAGFLSVGKTNMDEFAMGSTNETSFFGAVKNPHNLNLIAGGSSGGSAAAVAAGFVSAATGTDTGGSIRQPAAFCGISGIKPTYGRVSRYGMVAYASSLDQGGAMARTAEDCAKLLTVMSGFDANDSTSLQLADEDFSRELTLPLNGLKLGIPKEFLNAGLDSDVAHVFEETRKQYERLGAQCVEISLPRTNLSIPAYYVIAPAEASANLSRFDGVRYGYRTSEYADLVDMYEKTRAEGFGAEVKRRILIGTYVLSHGYYDAYYLKAQKIRRLIAEDFATAFQSCDVILSPVAPTAAWKLGEMLEDPVQMYLADIFTLSVNLAGLPAMSIPAGFTTDARPIGMQLIAPMLSEARLLNVAHQFQLSTDFHTKTPKGA